MTHQDPRRCICQGRGYYYVHVSASLKMDFGPNWVPPPNDTTEVPCRYHDRQLRLNESDRTMLSGLGIG